VDEETHVVDVGAVVDDDDDEDEDKDKDDREEDCVPWHVFASEVCSQFVS
jgi:hypothetical protein